MSRIALSLLFAALALPALAANSKPTGTEKTSIAQLEQTLAAAQGKLDADLAQQLLGMELVERLDTVRLARLQAALPGVKSRQSLLILADQSEFLPPPDDEAVQEAVPEPAETRQMLVRIVNYVNSTIRQLPNLMALRKTTGFQDRPQEDRQEETAVVSLSYMPLHDMGSSSIVVTYRDHKEVVDESATKAAKKSAPVGGLVTSGEFGPILSTVLADAIKGKITWARWQQGAAGRVAVFHYVVPAEKSNFNIKFCCVVNGYGSNGLPEKVLFDERSGYHGEIVFDPADGSILRLTLEAELPSGGLVPRAGIAIEYGPVEIAGKSYICPARSVSILEAHTTQQPSTASRSQYRGPAKTFLNDVVFSQYRRFGSETRILPGESEPPPK